MPVGTLWVVTGWFKPDRGDRKHGNPTGFNQEGVFIRAMGGTHVFDDPQATGRELVCHPVVEEDDTVGDIFFQALAGERIFSLFTRNDGRHALVFEPSEEAAQFGPKDQGAGQPCKK